MSDAFYLHINNNSSHLLVEYLTEDIPLHVQILQDIERSSQKFDPAYVKFIRNYRAQINKQWYNRKMLLRCRICLVCSGLSWCLNMEENIPLYKSWVQYIKIHGDIAYCLMKSWLKHICVLLHFSSQSHCKMMNFTFLCNGLKLRSTLGGILL